MAFIVAFSHLPQGRLLCPAPLPVLQRSTSSGFTMSLPLPVLHWPTVSRFIVNPPRRFIARSGPTCAVRTSVTTDSASPLHICSNRCEKFHDKASCVPGIAQSIWWLGYSLTQPRDRGFIRSRGERDYSILLTRYRAQKISVSSGYIGRFLRSQTTEAWSWPFASII